MTIRYTMTGDRANDHRVPVVGTIDGLSGPSFDLVLPVWVPGSYYILDYPRFVDGLTARLPSCGRSLPVERIDKGRWRITTEGADTVEVAYSIYAYQMVNEAIDVTDEHLFVNAALGLPYVEGRKDEPYEVALHIPPDWKVYTELAEVGSAPPRFRAKDYDELVDSPIDCGTPVDLGFHAAGIGNVDGVPALGPANGIDHRRHNLCHHQPPEIAGMERFVEEQPALDGAETESDE